MCFFFFFFKLSVHVCVCARVCVFLTVLYVYVVRAVLGLHCCLGSSPVAGSRATLRCGARVSHCSSISCCRALALGRVGFSSWSSQILQRRRNSCGPWAWLLRGMWGVPGSWSNWCLLLWQAFFTTEPPEKPQNTHFQNKVQWQSHNSFGFYNEYPKAYS